MDIKQAVGEAVEQMEYKFAHPKEEVNVPIKFRQLNYFLNGFHRTDLVLIAARPGQGKTSIGMNFITDAALDTSRKTDAGAVDPYKCAVFSLEMSAVQLANRMLASVAKVDMGKALRGNLDPDEWRRISEARKRLSQSKIYIDDSSLTTPVEILSKCRRLKREIGGLDLVMVDYLQLMSSGKKVDSRQQEVADITRTMKIAAKELNVPILLLSQMSREVEKRNTKEPQMSDLRESSRTQILLCLFIVRTRKPTPFPTRKRARWKFTLPSTETVRPARFRCAGREVSYLSRISTPIPKPKREREKLPTGATLLWVTTTLRPHPKKTFAPG